MVYQEIFDKYLFRSEKALEYGFEHTKEGYLLQRELSDPNFTISIRIDRDWMELRVYEAGEEYLPFFAKSAEGSFVTQIREEVDRLIDDMVGHCFEPTYLREKLINHVLEKHQSTPDYPWDDQSYCTIRTPKAKKWYGIFMHIKYRALGIDRDGKIDVLNVKAPPKQIPELIDRRHYFPAYHMNKKHWLSILLDSSTDIQKVQELLDQSYLLVEGNSLEVFMEREARS